MKQSTKLPILGFTCYITPGIVGLLLVIYFPSAIFDELPFILPLFSGAAIPFIFLNFFGYKIVKEIKS